MATKKSIETTMNVVEHGIETSNEITLEQKLANLKQKELEIKELIKAQKEEAKKLKEEVALAKQEEKAKVAKEKALKLAELLSQKDNTPKVNKTQVIKELLQKGMSMDDIVKTTGYGRKEVNDRVWLIEKKLGIR